MRKVREVLRLKWELCLSHRQVARSVRLGHGTVCDCLQRAKLQGERWAHVADMSDAELETWLYPGPSSGSGSCARAVPDWAAVRNELKKKGVTLSLLWQEYRERHRDGYGRSRFCQLYRQWEGRLRQDYEAGEMLFVDYAGQTVDDAAKEKLWRGAPGGSMPSRAGDPRPVLPEREVDPEERPGPTAVT